ncbi:MAG: RraA family protein [Pirellulales bacterium]
MKEEPHLAITISMLRERIYSAVVLDSLDAVGLRRQSPRVPLVFRGGHSGPLVGRCKTTLWADMSHPDDNPYGLELQAVDTCAADDVLIAAAGGSMRSGIWGELLSTAARNQGCVGAIVDGAVRDVHAMRAIGFPVFSRGTSPYDSRDRQRVIDVDVPVEIDGVLFSPGDLVIADDDGVVVVPQAVEEEVIRRAWEKINAEDTVRDSIRKGMTATEAFRKYGVL